MFPLASSPAGTMEIGRWNAGATGVVDRDNAVGGSGGGAVVGDAGMIDCADDSRTLAGQSVAAKITAVMAGQNWQSGAPQCRSSRHPAAPRALATLDFRLRPTSRSVAMRVAKRIRKPDTRRANSKFLISRSTSEWRSMVGDDDAMGFQRLITFVENLQIGTIGSFSIME
jgi:hypothetical protein